MAARRRPDLNVEIGRRSSDPCVTGIQDRPPAKRRIQKLESGVKIYDLYYWQEVLQQDGDGGKVVVCRKKNDSDQEFKYVLKIRSKKAIARHQSESDIKKMLLRILNLPPHLGVTPIIEILEDKDYYYCVMEKAAGGSLVDHLLSRHQDGIMPEVELKQMMRDMLEAIGHVHKQGVLHRDIKPQNFVVRRIQTEPELGSSNGASRQVVERVSLIDFDHAETDFSPISPSPKSDCVYGTQGFNAPEQYLGNSSAASDLFSIGVILYLFMTGSMPYDTARMEKEAKKEHREFSTTSHNSEPGCYLAAVYDKMLAAPPTFDGEPWTSNKACSNFCQTLMAFHSKCRPETAEEALLHPWLAKDVVSCVLPRLPTPHSCAQDGATISLEERRSSLDLHQITGA